MTAPDGFQWVNDMPGQYLCSLAARTKQKGISLIEVLITMLVIGIGLLGMAKLQLSSVQSNYSSQLRSHATWLANDLLDRMRANPDADFSDGAANDDRQDWDQLLTDLMGATASAAVETIGDETRITISWNDERGSIRDGSGDAVSQTQSFVYQTEL
jgi:type IV pilus assembly protein PilV